MGVMRLGFLLLFIASVSSLKKPIKDIAALKNTGYGRYQPRHGLSLLFWLAHILERGPNGLYFQNIDVNPFRGDYGLHPFGNRENILPILSNRQQYQLVGNLNPARYPGVRELPPDVRRYYRNSRLLERNMDRLIVSMDQNSPGQIFSTFITSHNIGENSFNVSDTYMIGPELIEQIAQMQYNDYLNRVGYISSFCLCRDLMDHSSYSQCNAFEEIKLDIKTTIQGNAQIIWQNIPADLMKTYIYIDIGQNIYSKDNDEVQTFLYKGYIIKQSSGALDTSVPINAGLQLYTGQYGSKNIWYGPEFDGANRVLPVRIRGCDASLQLYAKDGKACARLYIKKTYSNWYNVFYNSWVGFYKSLEDKNNGYYTYQYVVKFAKTDNMIADNYDIYQYDSSLTIAPGVQIRFLLDKGYDKVLAQTAPWEDEPYPPKNCNLRSDLSSSWSFPEFCNEPEFYDANDVAPVEIGRYDAGLQLFTKDGQACARLYIRKTFGGWKKTFDNSWVGFYLSSNKGNNGYYTYQYAVKFEMQGSTETLDIYEYKSSLTIAPGVQIRFLLDKSYNNVLAQTDSWTCG